MVQLRLDPCPSFGCQGFAHLFDAFGCKALQEVAVFEEGYVIFEQVADDAAARCLIGVDYWDFDCKFGATQDAATVAHLAELMPLIDALVQGGGTQFYVEILVKHGHRKAREQGEAATAPD